MTFVTASTALSAVTGPLVFYVLGVTGAIDAGGGSQNYPEDYAVIEKLAADG